MTQKGEIGSTFHNFQLQQRLRHCRLSDQLVCSTK